MCYLPIKCENKQICDRSNKEHDINSNVGTTQSDSVTKLQVVISVVKFDRNDEKSHKYITHNKGNNEDAVSHLSMHAYL